MSKNTLYSIESAELLGNSLEAVRACIKRGTLAKAKCPDGIRIISFRVAEKPLEAATEFPRKLLLETVRKV